MKQIVKVALVDDHKIFRTGLELILSGLDNVEVIGSFSNATDLLTIVHSHTIDLVFMDIKMPELDGITATEMLLAQKPKTKVLALTMFGEIEYFNKMLDAGAQGFLLKKTQEDELEKAITQVMSGGTYFSIEFQSAVVQRQKKMAKTDIHLSERETEVLEYICKGFSNNEIAEALHLSHHTVDGHRRNLIQKTGVKNAASLVMFSIKHGLIEI